MRRVTAALNKLAPTFIKWPQGENVQLIQTGFEKMGGMRGIIGAIDGTHIPIKAPKHEGAEYVNRKGVHSIQLQVGLLIFYYTS